MKIPYLKRRLPRIETSLNEKLVQGSVSDHLEDHCIGELFDALESKDIKKLRGALDALVMNCFEEEQDD